MSQRRNHSGNQKILCSEKYTKYDTQKHGYNEVSVYMEIQMIFKWIYYQKKFEDWWYRSSLTHNRVMSNEAHSKMKYAENAFNVPNLLNVIA